MNRGSSGGRPGRPGGPRRAPNPGLGKSVFREIVRGVAQGATDAVIDRAYDAAARGRDKDPSTNNEPNKQETNNSNGKP